MSALLSLSDSLSEWVFSLIGSLLYPIFNIFFILIDLVQNIFYAFAGLGNATINGVSISFDVGRGGFDSNGNYQNGLNGSDTENGILYYIFRTTTVRNILVSMLILGLVLLIVFTALAFIRNVYQPKQKKWQEIVSSSIKGLIHFIALPVFCLLGVLAGNALLRVLDQATSGGENVAISRQLFIASSYSANAFRRDKEGDGAQNDDHKATFDKFYALCSRSQDKGWAKTALSKLGSANSYSMAKNDYYAEVMDEAFRSADGPSIAMQWDVSPYYNLWNINFLALAAGGIFLLFVLGSISFAMVKRLFMLTLLFAISPAICSLYPLDDGSSVNKWKGDFMKNFFMAYGAVVGLNLYFQIMPVINSIDISGDWSGIVPLLLTIAGLFMVKDFISLMSGYLHGDDAYGTGVGLFNQVKNRVRKGAAWTGKRVAGAVGVFSRAKGAQHARDEYFMKKVGGDDAARKEGESWRQYKKRINENNIGGGWSSLKGAARDRRRNGTGDATKDAVERREAGRGFAGGLGAGLADTGLNILDAITGATGFGKVRDFGKAYTEGSKKGFDDKNKKIKYQQSLTEDAKNKADVELLAQKINDAIKGITWDAAGSVSAMDDNTFKSMKQYLNLLNGANGDAVFKALQKPSDTAAIADYDAFLSKEGLDRKTATKAEVTDRIQKIVNVGESMQSAAKASSLLADFDKELENYYKKRIDELKTATGSTWDTDELAEQMSKGIAPTIQDRSGAKLEDIKLADALTGIMERQEARRENLRTDVKNAEIKVNDAKEEYKDSGGMDTALITAMENFSTQLRDSIKDIDVSPMLPSEVDKITNKLQDMINMEKESLRKLTDASKAQGSAIEKAVAEMKKKH